MSKGTNRRPELDPGSYQRGHERIDWSGGKRPRKVGWHMTDRGAVVDVTEGPWERDEPRYLLVSEEDRQGGRKPALSDKSSDRARKPQDPKPGTLMDVFTKEDHA